VTSTINDHRRRAAYRCFFSRRELTPLHHAQTDRLEVVRRDRVAPHAHEFTGRIRVLVLQPRPTALDGGAGRIVAEWHGRCLRDGLDAWRRAQCLEHAAMRLAPLDRVVATQRRVDLRNRQLTDLEAWIRRCARGRATHEQSARDQQS
jgi:hypothetical protein